MRSKWIEIDQSKFISLPQKSKLHHGKYASSQYTINNEFLSSTFFTLCQVAEERANELQNYGSTVSLRMMTRMKGSLQIRFMFFLQTVKAHRLWKMTNFSPAEIDILCHYFDSIVGKRRNRREGSRSNYTILDVLYMVLTVFRNGCSWDFLGFLFKI